MNSTLNAFNTIRERQKYITAKRSSLDKEVVDLYHIIECLDLSADRLSRVMKKLKSTLKERREIKKEAAFIDSLWSRRGKESKEYLVKANKKRNEVINEAKESYERLFTTTGAIK